MSGTKPSTFSTVGSTIVASFEWHESLVSNSPTVLSVRNAAEDTLQPKSDAPKLVPMLEWHDSLPLTRVIRTERRFGIVFAITMSPPT